MSISETVARLANALHGYLVAKGGPTDVTAMLELVVQMPVYVRDARLDLVVRALRLDALTAHRRHDRA